MNEKDCYRVSHAADTPPLPTQLYFQFMKFAYKYYVHYTQVRTNIIVNINDQKLAPVCLGIVSNFSLKGANGGAECETRETDDNMQNVEILPVCSSGGAEQRGGRGAKF